MINPASITEEMKDAYYAVKQYYYQEDVKALLFVLINTYDKSRYRNRGFTNCRK